MQRALQEFQLSLMEYNALISAIPRRWRRDTLLVNNITLYEKVVNNAELSATLYKMMTSDHTLMVSKRRKWEEELNTSITQEQFEESFGDIYKLTNITKYRSFQYRLLTRAITMNIHLHKWGMLDSPNCSW